MLNCSQVRGGWPIRDTAFEPYDEFNSVFPTGSGFMTCSQNPCEKGQQCVEHYASLACSACPRFTYSPNGVQCNKCPPGRTSADDHTECLACVGTTFSIDGQCEPCLSPSIVNDAHTTCARCDPGQAPNDNRTACLPCEGATYSAFGVECTQCLAPFVVNADRTTCLACLAGHGPSDEDVRDCTACVGTTYSTIGICQECGEPNIVNDAHTTCAGCDPGQAPNENRTACLPCAGATYSAFGVECTQCLAPFVVNADRTTCSMPQCYPGLTPASDGSGCVCAGNSYNASAIGILSCGTSVSDAPNIAPGVLGCVQCPACANCTDGVVSLLSGWRLSPRDDRDMNRMLLHAAAAGAIQQLVAFSCPQVRSHIISDPMFWGQCY
eukprot:SAG11_NODE_353_length_10348_cov_6.938335_6_plen_381_part_00